VDDPKAFDLMGSGNTAGMFQVEGSGMTRYLVQMKPRKLENVIAMVALYRPGPMQFIPLYIERMHGLSKTEFRHPALRPIYESTYGIPVYQEQLMRAAVELAGYSPSDADDLRSAISKKKKEKIEEHRVRFVKGALEHGIDEKTANVIFSDWEEFARYGFNKSHAADYGVIAVQTAFLKAHYPAEFFTALLSVNKNDTAKVAFYSADSRNMGIEVLPPCINTSAWDFAIEDQQDGKNAIRFGLGAIKNVGQAPVDCILLGRGNRPFKDLNDLAQRADLRAVGKRALECLVKVGALDPFGSRPAMLACIDRLIAISASHFRSSQDGQLSLFGEATGVHENLVLPEVADIDRREQLNWEHDLLGLYVSEHPLTSLMPSLTRIISYFSGQLSEASDQEAVRLAGLVVGIRPYQTKSGKMMGFVTMEDIQGNIDLVLFPRTWEKFETTLKPGDIIIAEGKVDAANTPPKILVDNIRFDIREFLSEEAAIPPVSPSKPIPPAAGQDASPAQVNLVAEPVPLEFEDDVDDGDMPPPPETFPPGWEGLPLPEQVSSKILETREETSLSEGEAAVSPVAVQVTAVPPKVLAPGFPVMQPASRLSLVQASAREEHAPRMITVILHSSGEAGKDQRRIQRLHGVLISCPGKDHFTFHIKENGHSFLMEFPNDNTRVCPELISDLQKIVPEKDILIEPILFQ
jgi:DNA polymerase-3 subunit alpha